MTPDITEERVALLNDIAVMMSEFVDNWPQPKRVSTALALIAKTMRAALDPPRHDFWGAGEKDCPREIKAGNGELHTLRCKVCGEDNPRDQSCRDRSTALTRTDNDVSGLVQALELIEHYSDSEYAREKAAAALAKHRQSNGGAA